MPPPAPAAPAAPGLKANDKAIASLIAGILGWTILPVVGGMLAVILGRAARDEIKRTSGATEGDTMAMIGILLGYTNLGVAALGIITVVLLAIVGIAVPLFLGLCGMCFLFGA